MRSEPDSSLESSEDIALAEPMLDPKDAEQEHAESATAAGQSSHAEVAAAGAGLEHWSEDQLERAVAAIIPASKAPNE